MSMKPGRTNNPFASIILAERIASGKEPKAAIFPFSTRMSAASIAFSKQTFPLRISTFMAGP